MSNSEKKFEKKSQPQILKDVGYRTSLVKI